MADGGLRKVNVCRVEKFHKGLHVTAAAAAVYGCGRDGLFVTRGLLFETQNPYDEYIVAFLQRPRKHALSPVPLLRSQFEVNTHNT